MITITTHSTQGVQPLPHGRGWLHEVSGPTASREGLATRGVRPLPHGRGWLHEVSGLPASWEGWLHEVSSPLPHGRGWPARLAIEQIQVLCQHILEPHNNGLFPWILSATHTHRGYIQQVTVTPNTVNSVLWVHETPPTFSPGEGRAGGLCFFPLACINNGVKDDVIIISPVVHYSTA